MERPPREARVFSSVQGIEKCSDGPAADPLRQTARAPMSQLEYLIALISIIVGLGFTDLAQSLRELVRPSRSVEWHWLPLLWTANIFLIALQLWWASFDVLQLEIFGRALAFLPYLLLFVGLYLASAFALPDLRWGPSTSASSPGAEGNDGLDLEAFYFSEEHRRWFFGTLIGVTFLGQIISLPLLLAQGTLTLLQAGIMFGQNALVAALLAVLILTTRWWVHAGIGILVFSGLVYTLGAGVAPIG